MAQETKLVHDYANCRDAKNIQSLARTRGLIQENKPFTTRRATSEKLFYSQSDMDNYLSVSQSGNPFMAKQRKREDYRLATEGDYAAMLPHAREFEKFLDNTMVMPAALQNFPQMIFKNAVESSLLVCLPTHDGWKCQIGLVQPMPEIVTLEDLLEIWGILLPLNDPNSDVKFEHTKKCVVCGKYYQAKGAKAIYCSERCRGQARNQKRKEDMNKE